jgi:hypothetical protein
MKLSGKTMKGQVTFVNLLGVFITLIIYFIVVIPVLQPMVDTAVAYYTAHPSSYSDVEIALLYMLPFIILVAIIMTALNYAIPQREGVRY